MTAFCSGSACGWTQCKGKNETKQTKGSLLMTVMLPTHELCTLTTQVGLRDEQELKDHVEALDNGRCEHLYVVRNAYAHAHTRKKHAATPRTHHRSAVQIEQRHTRISDKKRWKRNADSTQGWCAFQ